MSLISFSVNCFLFQLQQKSHLKLVVRCHGMPSLLVELEILTGVNAVLLAFITDDLRAPRVPQVPCLRQNSL